jgi:hypothetical protein
MDAELHRARIDTERLKITSSASLNSLPDGCFISVDDSSYPVWGDALLLWSPEAYLKKERRPKALTLTVLTPEPIIQRIRQGYKPDVHQSARTLNGAAHRLPVRPPCQLVMRQFLQRQAD